MAHSAATTPDIIEGVFRVVATTDPKPARKSPNQQRKVARIVFWNSAMLIALVAAPLVF